MNMSARLKSSSLMLLLAAGALLEGGCPQICALHLTQCAGDPRLVGTWQDSNSSNPTRTTVRFMNDSTYTSYSATTITGTYDAAGTQMTLTPDGKGVQFKATYYVSQDGQKMQLNAFLPSGHHSGVTGTWCTDSAQSQLDPKGQVTGTHVSQMCLLFQPEGRLVHHATSDGKQPIELVGSYSPLGGNRYSVSITSPNYSLMGTATVLDDAALVLGDPYQRIN